MASFVASSGARIAWVSLLVSSLWVGCGGKRFTQSSPPDPEALASALAPVYADAYTACLGPAKDQLLATFLHGADIVELSHRQLVDEFAQLADAAEAGRVTWHPDQLSACVEAMKAEGCELQIQRWQPACERAVEGRIAVGEACQSDWDCAGDAVCDYAEQCPGTCERRVAAGSACVRNEQCEDGLVCFEATGKCTAPRGLQERCGGGVEPPCEPTLFCLGDDASTTPPKAGTCVSPADAFTAPTGEDCISNLQLCVAGDYCALMEIGGQGDASLSFKCRPAETSGSSCSAGMPEGCPSGEYCALAPASLRGTCRALPAEGEACAHPIPSEAREVCGAYTTCVGGVCRALQHLGGTCQSGEECYSGVCLDGACVSNSSCLLP